LVFIYFLNVILISRLGFGFRTEPVSKSRLTGIIIFQILFLFLFEISIQLIFSIITLAILDLLFYWIEGKSNNLNLIRWLSLIITFLIFGILSFIYIPKNFNSIFFNLIKDTESSSYISAVLMKVNWYKFNLILFGVLLLLNETNFVIRYFFDKFKLAPQMHNLGEEKMLDNKEYNTGRIIGMIERILIFFFILAGEYAAIGFIIAAKGFTRFRELDNRDFAEYVLIGTLLSSLSAITIALLIKSVL